LRKLVKELGKKGNKVCPTVQALSPDEVARFLEAAPGIKYKAAFSVAYGAGLRVCEDASLKVSDIRRMLPIGSCSRTPCR
jgi:integrase